MTTTVAERLDVDLIEHHLPTYDVVITEHLVVEAPADAVYAAARDLDFMTVRSPLLVASMFVRGVPARLRGHTPPKPAALRLASDSAGLPGWLLLGVVPGREIAFGAVGQFWKSDIEWRDVPVEDFAGFAEPGWGKIACHFLIRPLADGRTSLTYECRTGTTDVVSRKRMLRYWALIRLFVGHIMRATLRTIADAARPTGEVRTP
jgi:hypothetical protein